MKVIQNGFSDFIVARGFAALTVWPFIFVRRDARVTERLVMHERIHGRQQLEMLWVLFFVWYGVEWVVRWCMNRGSAYRSVAFEREAYCNEAYREYFCYRRPFEWVRYLKRRG